MRLVGNTLSDAKGDVDKFWKRSGVKSVVATSGTEAHGNLRLVVAGQKLTRVVAAGFVWVTKVLFYHFQAIYGMRWSDGDQGGGIYLGTAFLLGRRKAPVDFIDLSTS